MNFASSNVAHSLSSGNQELVSEKGSSNKEQTCNVFADDTNDESNQPDNNNNDDNNNNNNDNGGATPPDKFVNSFIPLVCYSIIIAMGGLLFGYDIGTIGGMVDLPSFVERFGDEIGSHQTVSFKPSTKGAIVSISCLGGLTSGLFANKIIPAVGMKITMIIAFMLYFMGNVMVSLIVSWKYLLIARFFNGLAIGILTITCPMFISEVSPMKQRGTFTCFNQLFTTIGIVIGSAVILFSSSNYFSSDKSQYQMALCLGMLFTILGSILILFVPESPNWLIRKNKPLKKVEKSISRISGYDINDEKIVEIATSFYDYNSQLKLQNRLEGKFSNSIIRGQPKYLFRTLLGMALYVFQQFTGINFFFYYGITIFKNVALASPYMVPVIFSMVNLLFSISAVIIITKFKRRTLLIFGSITMSTIMILFTVVGTFMGSSFGTTVALIILSCSFISTFSVSWGPISNILISEMYPPTIKVKAMSICGSTSWVFNFAIALIIPSLTAKIGLSIGWIFATMTILSSIFVYFFIPETKHIPTSRLDKYYSKKGYFFQGF